MSLQVLKAHCVTFVRPWGGAAAGDNKLRGARDTKGKKRNWPLTLTPHKGMLYNTIRVPLLNKQSTFFPFLGENCSAYGPIYPPRLQRRRSSHVVFEVDSSSAKKEVDGGRKKKKKTDSDPELGKKRPILYQKEASPSSSS